VLFHSFNSQEERRRFGSSAFIEIQFCRLASGTSIKELVAVDNINHWQNDSLYIKDETAFYQEYKDIFDCGTYSNLESGTVDVYGINYYAPSLVGSIAAKLREIRPADYEILSEWLLMAGKYNGFYILGL